MRIVRTPPPLPAASELIEPRPLHRPKARPALGTRGGTPIFVGGESTPRDFQTGIAPNYPLRARQRSLEGQVVLRYTGTPNGAVHEVRVVESTHCAFGQSAIDEAYRHKYCPRIVHGEPVELRDVTRVSRFVLSR